MNILKHAFIIFCMAFSLAACESDGPMENAGENVDQAVENTGDAMDDAGDNVEDTFD